MTAEGGRLNKPQLWLAVEARTRAALRREINPHLFHDAVAILVAFKDPAHVRAAAWQILRNTHV